MSLLSLEISKCVHTSNKFAICNACVESCPVETIKIDNSQVSFTPSECIGCGGCLSACPTDAYALDDFKPINYVFDFLENDSTIVTCKDKNLPCIAGLSVEELLSMALISSKEIKLDIGVCADCSIAQTNLAIIENRAQEVNFLLEALEQEKYIALEELNVEIEQDVEVLSRRKLFSKDGVKTAFSIKQQFENRVDASSQMTKNHVVTPADITRIKEKNIPDRRSLLSMAMKRAKIPEIFHTISIEDISFISQKDMDESSCTNCQMCYRICPTGALSSDYRGSVINFNPLACVKCHSCHDVCEPESLTLRPTFSLLSMFESKIETLIRFDMRRCDECGVLFAYKGGEIMCHRCAIEEEEARELWGIK